MGFQLNFNIHFADDVDTAIATLQAVKPTLPVYVPPTTAEWIGPKGPAETPKMSTTAVRTAEADLMAEAITGKGRQRKGTADKAAEKAAEKAARANAEKVVDTTAPSLADALNVNFVPVVVSTDIAGLSDADDNALFEAETVVEVTPEVEAPTAPAEDIEMSLDAMFGVEEAAEAPNPYVDKTDAELRSILMDRVKAIGSPKNVEWFGSVLKAAGPEVKMMSHLNRDQLLSALVDADGIIAAKTA